jgi:hypothetical protein
VIRGGGEMLNCVAIVPVWHRLSLPVLSSVR